jgi:hypothetical protein
VQRKKNILSISFAEPHNFNAAPGKIFSGLWLRLLLNIKQVKVLKILKVESSAQISFKFYLNKIVVNVGGKA